MSAGFTFAIIMMIILIGFWIWVISSPFSKYKKAEELSGTILMEVVPSKKEKFWRIASLAACFILYFVLRLKRGNLEISSLMILLGCLVSSVLQFKNQKICEKGILLSTGLVEWNAIESVEDIDEMSDKIKVRLNKKVNGFKKITLYCTPGEAMDIVRMIERNRMRSEHVFRNDTY